MTPPVTLDPLDAVEVGEALKLLVHWLHADDLAKDRLAVHLGHRAAADTVICDLARLTGLFPGTQP
jgi:hypothetical protein